MFCRFITAQETRQVHPISPEPSIDSKDNPRYKQRWDNYRDYRNYQIEKTRLVFI
jgi:hypothetical protein